MLDANLYRLSFRTVSTSYSRRVGIAVCIVIDIGCPVRTYYLFPILFYRGGLSILSSLRQFDVLMPERFPMMMGGYVWIEKSENIFALKPDESLGMHENKFFSRVSDDGIFVL